MSTVSTGRDRLARVAPYVAGIVAGAAMLAVGEVLAALLRQRTGPVAAVAELVRDLTPAGLVKGFIELVGTADKPILIAVVTVGALALCAVAGRWRFGWLVLVGLGVLASVAVLVNPGESGVGAARGALAVPPGLATCVGVACLAVLQDADRAARRRELEDPADGTGRRRFLVIAGGIALTSVVVGAAGRLAGRTRRTVEAAREALVDRLRATPGEVPAGAQLDVPGLGRWQVPGEQLYRIDTAFAVPLVDPEAWRIRIHGMVEKELELSLADLLERPATEAWTTLCCVSNPVGGDLIGNAWWTGVRIAPLLAEAGVRAGADAVLQTSDDGWTCGTPLGVLTDDRDAMLAYAMNGEPLPIEHGFPVRVVVPGLYGYVSATKWVVDLEVTRFDAFEAYWTQRGWAVEGPVKTQSRVLVPRNGTDVRAGEVDIAGDAWAQHRGIEKVEVQVDGGPWTRCDLGTVPSADTWVQWSTRVTCGPGEHTVVVRATDAEGETQTSARTDVVPDGASGWHQVRFTAG